MTDTDWPDTRTGQQVHHPAAAATTTTTTTTTTRDILLSTAQEVIQAYNTWTPASVLSFRSPTCLHRIRPSTLNYPALTNEQYAAYFNPIMPAFDRFHLTVHDSIVDEVARKVVMHASSSAVTKLGPYGNEYVLILHMTEDGRQVDRFDEFVDSAYSTDYMPRLRDALAAESAQGK